MTPAAASIHVEFLGNYGVIIVRLDKSTHSFHGLETELIARKCAEEYAKQQGITLTWQN